MTRHRIDRTLITPARAALAVLAAAVLFALAPPAPAMAASPEIYTGRFSNLAAGGADVVAYFTEGRKVEGSSDHTHVYKGAEWRFASAENRDAFAADPQAYAPQYGGYCAWAIAEGKLAKGDLDFWTIVDGKLYLNFNQSVQDRWLADVPGFIAKADANWPAILEQ